MSFFGIGKIKFRMPKVRVPKVKPGRTMPKPRGKKPAAEKMDWFSLTIFSSNKGPKGIKKIEVIRELLASGGNRKAASRKLGVTGGVVSQHAKKIRHLPDADLRIYATRLNTTVDEIKRVCADFGTKKGLTHIGIIQELFAARGNRTVAAQRMGITDGVVSRRVKNIRQLPDADLQKYADKLNTTIDEIKRVCADLDPKKRITHMKVICALLASDGNRTTAAQRLRITESAVSHHAKNIRRLSDADLQKYVSQLNTTIDEIRRVCADLNSTKGVTHIDIIRELLACDGNRSAAAQNLGINPGAVSNHAKNIRQLPDADLQKYVSQLNTTIDEIKRVCADLDSKKRITHVQVIRALLACDGNRTAAAQMLRIEPSGVSNHAKNIRQLPDADLQKYAEELNKGQTLEITVCIIRDVIAPRKIGRINFEQRIQVIRALLASDGNRTTAAQGLRITDSGVSHHAKNIRRLPDADLQKYAKELKTTVSEIKRVCADFDSAKRVTHIDVIRALIVSDGNRTAAAQNLGVSNSVVGQHAQNIRRLPEADLAKYAAELGVSVERIREVCASRIKQAKRNLFKK